MTTLLFNVLPLVLVGTGAAILFWPRQPGPMPRNREEEYKAFNRLAWRRFLFAAAFMALAFTLVVIGQNQTG